MDAELKDALELISDVLVVKCVAVRVNTESVSVNPGEIVAVAPHFFWCGGAPIKT